MRLRILYIIVFALLLQQCAKQTAPTGGPADKTPPKLKESFPKHEQINFKGNRIELFFDEPIQLLNAREEILITPTVGKKFEVTANKSRVTLDLQEVRLQENTTYNINFREAIQDITEKNPAVVKLAFSTGPYIDSLVINGKVLDALTEKNPKNYTVALAEASDTFNIFKHPATWLTQTDTKGKFSIENLKPGKYFVYAFDDRSKNLIVDSKSEPYGFLSQPIDLQKNADSLKIRTFKLDNNSLRLITGRPTFAYFNLRFSKSLINFRTTAVDTTRKVYSSLEPDLTTIKFYNTNPDLDSLQIRVQATDSLNTSVDSLVYIKFQKKESTRDKLTITVEKANIYESNSILTSQVSFTKPIVNFNIDSAFVQIDSATRWPITREELTWNENKTKLSLTKKIDLARLFPPDTATAKPKPTGSKTSPQKPALIFRPTTFISVEKDTSKLLNTPLIYIKMESTGILETEVQTAENFILQVIDQSGKVVTEIQNQKKYTFENLPPATYILRLIIDLNKNGKWDPGNFNNKKEPEPIIYYLNRKGVKEIPLKANWTVDKLLIKY